MLQKKSFLFVKAFYLFLLQAYNVLVLETQTKTSYPFVVKTSDSNTKPNLKLTGFHAGAKYNITIKTTEPNSRWSETFVLTIGKIWVGFWVGGSVTCLVQFP